MLIINLKFSLKGSIWVVHTNVLIHEYARAPPASINNLSSEHDISKATCRVRCCDVNTMYTCCPPTDDTENTSHHWPPRYMLACWQLEHVHIQTWDQCQCVCVVCVCPAFTVLGGKKTKKEGHHKDFVHVLSAINPRKGHRSVLHPVLASSLWPVFVVCMATAECCWVSAWASAGSLTAAPRPLQQRASPDTPAPTPANTATLSSRGGENLCEVSQCLEKAPTRAVFGRLG